jgi:hypothetical protein
MDENLDDALVSGYEHIVGQLSLPDPNDCHVLAAAIHGGASIIVTVNLRDFPANVIETHGIEAQHPDTFENWTSPGISTEMMDLYLEPYSGPDREGAGGGLATEHEHIKVTELSLDSLRSMAKRNEIDDLKTLTLMFLARGKSSDARAPRHRGGRAQTPLREPSAMLGRSQAGVLKGKPAADWPDDLPHQCVEPFV